MHTNSLTTPLLFPLIKFRLPLHYDTFPRMYLCLRGGMSRGSSRDNKFVFKKKKKRTTNRTQLNGNVAEMRQGTGIRNSAEFSLVTCERLRSGPVGTVPIQTITL